MTLAAAYGGRSQPQRSEVEAADRPSASLQGSASAVPHTTITKWGLAPLRALIGVAWIGQRFSLVSVAVGWILGLVTQQRQHGLDLKRFDREQQALQQNALRRRGEEFADEMIECLSVLRDVVPQTVYWQRQDPDAEADARARSELARLRGLALRHPDEAVRSVAELAYEVLQWPDDIVMWGGEGYGSPREVVWHTCERTLGVVGQYVRAEPVDTSTAELNRLRRAQEMTLAEKQSQWEEQAVAERPTKDVE